jgi:hypothetical protein
MGIMSRATRSERREPAAETLRSVSRLIPTISVRELQGSMNDVLDSLNDPEIRESLRKTVDLSYDTSLRVLQRAAKLSREVTSGDTAKLSETVRESVPALVKAELSMVTELMTLNQKYASKVLDILESSSRKQRKREGASSSQRDR